MRKLVFLPLACVLVGMAMPSQAAPGDVVVPAHRTKDGHWVPANVPPLSGGTVSVRRPGRGAAHRQASVARGRGQTLMPPLLVDAQPIRR